MIQNAEPSYSVYSLSELKQQFAHASEIHKPFGVLDTVLDWTKTNLKGRWGWQLVRASSGREDGRYIFFFDDEQDYLVFTLRWADGD